MGSELQSPDDSCLVQVNQVCPSCTEPYQTEADRMRSMMPHGAGHHEVQVWWSCPTCGTDFYNDYVADALAHHTVPDRVEPWVGDVDGGATCISVLDRDFNWDDVPRMPDL